MPQLPVKFQRASECTITSKTLTIETEYHFNSQVNKQGNNHRWDIEFRTGKLWQNDYRELVAFMTSLNGKYGTFTMVSPFAWLSPETSLTVAATASKGNKSIALKNLTPNLQGAVLAGDYIVCANHQKAYVVTVGTDADGLGNGTIEVYPPLFESVPTDTVISEAVFTLRLTSDNVPLNLRGSELFHNFRVSAKEDV